MKDYVIRAIDKEKSIRIFIATTTNVVEDARKIHNTSPTVTAALGRTLTASAIMGFMMKGEKDKLTLKIRGNGPIGNIIAVSNNKGEIKGYVQNPSADLPTRSDGKLDVGGVVGRSGKLTVIRDLGLKEPYIGQSNLITGEIGDDLAQYFVTSEQQPSAVALGVLVDKDLSTKAAGGFILQVLPNIQEENLVKLEQKINKLESISKYIDKGYTPEELLERLFGEFQMEIKDKKEIKYTCDCSRERLEGVLISVGEEELKKMIAEDGEAEVVCHFCNTKYHFNKEELEKLLEKAK
ncbi:Hsp33 family molecular chaperone HslO [Caldisalinibacter kiritimatiensis]|uniref:33 kDa chaperonin n=1 Tax=Caldisalinibacter kiritimatiensis TaxID=1304284 RepID=R1AUT2_9FIRM|nr:Hsp33 family molecular chaperone HslO [Caldisalinibacter kiritimatiensis]EOD00908.1 Chaperonin (heat shock protein 33) [Caldisalinibacter kiritimatiensis]